MTKRSVTLGLATIIVVTAWALGRAQTQVADFRVTIETTTEGAKLVCLKGCAWADLSFRCAGRQACKAEVDQTGVGTLGR